MREVAIEELRRLIVEAAPDRGQAEPALTCAEDMQLDRVMPFSSVIVLGVIVAVEDKYEIRVTKQMLARALTDGVTLVKIKHMIEAA